MKPLVQQKSQAEVQLQVARLPCTEVGQSCISIVIIAKDEEPFIGRCIQSVGWADDILVVVDAATCDRTAEIAESLGVRVYQQPWLGWSKQKGFGVAQARYDWVCVLDADEIVTAELAQSMRQVICSANVRDAFSVIHDLDFLGILIPSCPPWKRNGPIKLFNRQFSGYDQVLRIHEKVKHTGKVNLLKGKLVHWRGRTMQEYMKTYNYYTTIEAEVLHGKGVKSNICQILVRPILKFLLCYLIRGKFLFGIRGLIDALLVASVEFFRYAKLWEMQNVRVSVDPPFPITIVTTIEQNTSELSSVHPQPSSVMHPAK
jgi:glycosyltransferase involved in cell wall biosynthesis